ncbi:MATE family efflux transporter [Alteromonas lipolytica]|uniref:Multidrug export protein MepA n=1 Tax=Alteromonas lipolytica TaxID=1856405 RepID=A0A1E8FI86_9ALTE|nr:MATE family efflux transporter [Alteromonas lipolytica]OFI35641.1 MATE family efflux transporter [Alteromonas lipolytica]
MTEQTHENPYVTPPLPRVFLKTALPIILMMLVSGSLNLVDAYFIGVFVGADGLAAVTAMFPLFMVLIALSTWIASGFASVMARLSGAGDHEAARNAYGQAITLSLFIAVVLMILFSLTGQSLALMSNNGNETLAAMSFTYMNIIILGSPLIFWLGIGADSLRSEGHVGFMAIVSLVTTLGNGVMNYVFIVIMELGVAGSSYGTIAAQVLALGAIWFFRRSDRNRLRVPLFAITTERSRWPEFLSLGAPSSLTYIGVALTSAAILFSLQQWLPDSYAVTVSAYGVITRVMTFIFLPLLGLGLAMQSIVGNNVGAGAYQRSNRSLCIALAVALSYGLLTEALLWWLRADIGLLFVADPSVADEVARLLPPVSLALFLLGPLMMINFYFQSIGDARRAGILSIAKTYLFALPLVFILPLAWGEWGIWYAGPAAEFLALLLTSAILYQRAIGGNHRFGLLYKETDIELVKQEAL